MVFGVGGLSCPATRITTAVRQSLSCADQRSSRSFWGRGPPVAARITDHPIGDVVAAAGIIGRRCAVFRSLGVAIAQGSARVFHHSQPSARPTARRPGRQREHEGQQPAKAALRMKAITLARGCGCWARGLDGRLLELRAGSMWRWEVVNGA